MKTKVIAIDQSTSATKAMLFDEECHLLHRVNIPHQQYYPRAGWVEHDAREIFAHVLESVARLLDIDKETDCKYSLAITNQRETVVVWNKYTGQPVYPAIVWQCCRGAEICQALKEKGYEKMVQEKSGLLLDPYFSASGVKWILDNVEGAREAADKGDLLMGTIDSWVIWKLTEGAVHATDYTNASRTLLFNIHTLDWDDDLLSLFTIPRSMMPEARPCDSFFGETTFDGLFTEPIPIAGVLGDSHGALVGQMCFSAGLGKSTYGTGSSVMINIGEQPVAPPDGLVTSVGFSALGRVFYAFEGNIHCTGGNHQMVDRQPAAYRFTGHGRGRSRTGRRYRGRLFCTSLCRTGRSLVAFRRKGNHPGNDAGNNEGPYCTGGPRIYRLSGQGPGRYDDPFGRYSVAGVACRWWAYP